MTALHTVILVRVLTDHDPDQVRAARDLLSSDDRFFVPVTVLLETGWVLEAVYELERSAVADGFRRFLGLPNVDTDHPRRIAKALRWCDEWLDFARCRAPCPIPGGRSSGDI